MTKWIAQIEVEAECVFPESAEPVVYEDPHAEFRAHLMNRSVRPLAEKPLLELQLEFEADSLEEAAERVKPLGREFLTWLSLVTKCAFRLRRVERLVDWTPDLTMREQYVYHTDRTSMPQPVLSEEFVETIALLNSEKVPAEVKRAIRWFANGVGSDLMDDQFQCFFYAIEILAEYHKSPDRVPDLCPKCHGELFCRSCDTVSTHRPYAKQAINQLIKTVVSDNGDEAFALLDAVRNHVMHGRQIDEIEGDLPMSFEDVVDQAGGIAWTCIMNSIPIPPGTHTLALADVTTLVHKTLIVSAHVQTVVESEGDPKSPRLSGSSGLKISIIRKEADDEQGNT